jgi:hypothetical protein
VDRITITTVAEARAFVAGFLTGLGAPVPFRPNVHVLDQPKWDAGKVAGAHSKSGHE